MKRLPPLLQGLNNPIFARLYWAQTINLIGDALTWVGLALLAFELAGAQSGTVLAIALTLRVTAFVVLSPIAGAIADRVDRKRIMITTHLGRMAIVGLLSFVTQVWQIYAIVLLLNVFYAFFTPTYTATIPLVTTDRDRPHAIALSSATSQLLGVLGPGFAGGIAAWFGTRQVFWLDGLTFLLAAILVVTLPGQLMVNRQQESPKTLNYTLQDIRTGSACLFADGPIRYALAMQFVTAIAGAEVLVNTVCHIQGTMQLGKSEYGLAMAVLGIGATLASVGLGNIEQRGKPVLCIGIGTFITTMAILPANSVNFTGLLLLWAAAGVGQTLVNLSTQTLIADRVAVELQGRVYGAHFAWSHLWWAFAYPLAGWMGIVSPNTHFIYSGLIGVLLFIIIYLLLTPRGSTDWPVGLWHEHFHSHDKQHQHEHSQGIEMTEFHRHLHFHSLADSVQEH